MVTPSQRFVAHAPADQNPETVRQFQELEAYLAQLEARLAPAALNAIGGDVVLADAWAPLPFIGQPSVPSPGDYLVTIVARAEGANANAEAQLRVNDGSTVVEADIVPVGNRALTLVVNMVLPAQAGWVFEARGLNCTLTGVRASAVRIGAGP